LSFYAELKRRNVFKVAIAYTLIAWGLLEVSDTLGPAMRLPEWLPSAVAFLLILGFPIAIVFAWAVELTPDGLKMEKNSEGDSSAKDRNGKILNPTIAITLAAPERLTYFNRSAVSVFQPNLPRHVMPQ